MKDWVKSFFGKIKSRKFIIDSSPYAFLDFTIPLDGNSIIYQNNKKFVEKFLDSGTSKTIFKRLKYRDIVVSKNPTLAYPSFDRKKVLLVNGSGGFYKARIFTTSDLRFMLSISCFILILELI